MSNTHFIRTGINEFSVNPNFSDDNAKLTDVGIPPQDEQPTAPDNSSDMKNPFTNDTQEVEADVKSTPPSESALGGYTPIENEKRNSELIDKTPDNSDLNDPSQLKNDEPSTEEQEHPHQIQAGESDNEHELEVDIENPSELGIDKPEILPAGTPEQETPEPNSNQDALAIKVDENIMEDEGTALPLGEKIKKLQTIKEIYSKKSFLTMKQVLLVNEINKILKNVK